MASLAAGRFRELARCPCDLVYGAAALGGVECATLGWDGSLVPASDAIAVFTSARKAATLRALVQTRPPLDFVTRSFAAGAAARGRRAARGWRLRPRTVGTPMADGRATAAVDFDSASVTDCGCRAAFRTCDQEAVRLGGPHQSQILS